MKRTQKSQKRTKFLFLLIILTAILSITATYAWFSTQRDVEIANLEVKIESAQNLQISLDGENWANTITLTDMKQLYGTYVAPTSTDGTDDATVIYQAKKNDHANYIPTELLPVSSCGVVENGALQFVKGNVNGTTLKDITSCSESDVVAGAATLTKEGNNANHPYLIFDVYLRNLSRRDGATYTQAEADQVTEGTEGDTITNAMVGTPKPDSYDPLSLDKNSMVWVDSTEGVANTGLENTARIAFVPYGGSAALTADGATVRDITYNGKEQASIWEPNYLDHTEYVKNNNKRDITSTSQAVVTYPVNTEYTFQTTTTIETNSVPDDDDNLVETLSDITVLKPTYDSSTKKTTETVEMTTPDGSGRLSLKPNAISKVRIYLWLEGQDPDCIDLASTGKQLNATIRIVKDEYNASTGNSYDTTESTDAT